MLVNDSVGRAITLRLLPTLTSERLRRETTLPLIANETVNARARVGARRERKENVE